jgi:WD40 repeat protein
VATGRPTRTLFGPAGLAATSVAFSRDGTIITAGDANGKVYLWDVATGKLVRTFRSPGSQRVNGVTFSRNGTTIAATINGIHGKSSICLWDVATGHLIATLHDPHSEGAFPLEFNPDDSILAVGDANANTYLWKLSRFRPAE